MGSIDHHSTYFSTHIIDISQELSKDKKNAVYELLIKSLLEDKIKDFSQNEVEGWMPYEFEPTMNGRECDKPLEYGYKEKYDLLSATYLKRKYNPPKNFITNINSLPLKIKKRIIRDYTKKKYYDYIFTIRDNELVIIAAEEYEDNITPKLYKIAQNISEINKSSKYHVDEDLLLWLLLKVKKRTNGVLNNVKLISLNRIAIFLHGTGGVMDIKIEDVEKNLFTQLGGALRNKIEKIYITLEYNGRIYSFDLFSGNGIFIPHWGGMPTLTEPYLLSRTLDIVAISTNIIPTIIKEYIDDNDWQTNRNNIISQEKADVKKKVNRLL